MGADKDQVNLNVSFGSDISVAGVVGAPATYCTWLWTKTGTDQAWALALTSIACRLMLSVLVLLRLFSFFVVLFLVNFLGKKPENKLVQVRLCLLCIPSPPPSSYCLILVISVLNCVI